MSLSMFQKALQETRFALDQVVKYQVDLRAPTQSSTLTNFRAQQRDGYMRAYFSAVAALDRCSRRLFEVAVEGDDAALRRIRSLVDQLRATRDTAKGKTLIAQISSFAARLRVKPVSEGLRLSMPRLPAEVREDMAADIKEVRKCFDAGCLRSAIILCGRILETALHRKYYELTGNDLLEKAPGIGLGNLIAKMAEKGVSLDPGLPNQIHLINQVRVFSVHKKQRSFMPSKAQAHAIILYTMDVIEKLFA